MKIAVNHARYQPFLEQLFGAMTTEQVQQVFSVAETLHFEAGQYLFQEGDADNALYIVLSGRLRVLHRMGDNLPVEAMYQKPVRHVIGIALSAQSAHIVDIETIPSACEIFVNKITKKQRFRLPPMRAMRKQKIICKPYRRANSSGLKNRSNTISERTSLTITSPIGANLKK